MLHDNIRALLAQQNRTQLELATYVGVKPNTVSDWLNKGNSPKVEHIYRIADFFKVSFDYLFRGNVALLNFANGDSDSLELLTVFQQLDSRGKGIVRAVAEYAQRQAHTLSIDKIDIPAVEKYLQILNFPVYMLPASAGTGAFLDSNHYTLMDFPVQAVPVQASFGVRIQGDSMLPKYAEGDIVFVKLVHELLPGDIGIFLLENSGYCKKYIPKNGKVYLESLNKKYEPILLREGGDHRLVGKVIGSITP